MSVIAKYCPDITVNVADINEERIKKWNGAINQLPIFENGLLKLLVILEVKIYFLVTTLRIQ